MSRKNTEGTKRIWVSRLKTCRKFAAAFLMAGLLQAGMQLGVADPLPIFPPTPPVLEPDDASIDYFYRATGKAAITVRPTSRGIYLKNEN